MANDLNFSVRLTAMTDAFNQSIRQDVGWGFAHLFINKPVNGG